jgi:hypothetical protein
MTPQDYFNLFASMGGQANGGLPFLGQPPVQPQAVAVQPQGQGQGQGQPMAPLGQQQGGNAYTQMGGLIGGGLRKLASDFGANGNSNALADMVGFQPFGGGGWGSGE